jgi:hypothetical protein
MKRGDPRITTFEPLHEFGNELPEEQSGLAQEWLLQNVDDAESLVSVGRESMIVRGRRRPCAASIIPRSGYAVSAMA